MTETPKTKTLTIPAPLPFGDSSLRDRILLARFPKTDDLELPHVEAYSRLTDSSGSYLEQQTAQAARSLDGALREIIEQAVGALADLHEGKLPGFGIDGFGRFDSALRKLPVAETRLSSLVDATINNAHLEAHAAKVAAEAQS